MPNEETDQNGIPPEIKEIADDEGGELSQSIDPWLQQEFEAYFNQPPRDSLPLSLLREWPYGHHCGICRDFFRSKKARDPCCTSCRTIIDDLAEGLRQIVTERTDSGVTNVRKLVGEVLARCTCHDCGWEANANRMIPRDLPSLLEYLPGWAARYVQHYMRHVFWNRFRYNRRFAPRLSEEQKEGCRALGIAIPE